MRFILTTASNAVSQYAALNNNGARQARFARPLAITYKMQWNRYADSDYAKTILLGRIGQTNSSCHPSFSRSFAKRQVEFSYQISRQRPLRPWKGSCRTAGKYGLHIFQTKCHKL
jgi:hypothetical protein